MNELSTVWLWKHWGQTLTEERLGWGLAFDTFAAFVGLSEDDLLAIEQGKASPNDAERMAIAEALGRSVEELFPYPSSRVAAMLQGESDDRSAHQLPIADKGLAAAGDFAVDDLSTRRKERVALSLLQGRAQHPSQVV